MNLGHGLQGIAVVGVLREHFTKLLDCLGILAVQGERAAQSQPGVVVVRLQGEKAAIGVYRARVVAALDLQDREALQSFGVFGISLRALAITLFQCRGRVGGGILLGGSLKRLAAGRGGRFLAIRELRINMPASKARTACVHRRRSRPARENCHTLLARIPFPTRDNLGTSGRK